MRIESTNGKVKSTYRRPQLEKATVSPPEASHILEDILKKPLVQRLLGKLTTVDGEGRSTFERWLESYDNPNVPWRERAKFALPNLVIDLGLKKARVDRELMKRKLFHHHPTVRALTLTARSIAHFGLTIPQRFMAPLFVVWNITQACNLRCVHCYENAIPKPAADELTLERRIGLVDQMADAGVPFLAIAGGEPLVCKDLWKVLEHAHKRGIHLTIATNGTLLTPETVARLTETGVKYVEVSIDSISPELHDAFRGMPGAWVKSIQGIKNSVAARIRTGLATCFTRKTVGSVDEVVNFAIDLGCQTFSHFNFIPVGRGKGMADADLTPGQREVLVRKLVKHLQAGKINVVSTAPQFRRSCVVYGSEEGVFATGHAGRGEGKKTMVLSRYIGGCGAGRCYCSVQPNGDITPCVYISSLPVGSVRERKLQDIWLSCPLFEVLSDREDRADHCGVCDYRVYCGGCRARSLAYTEDIQAGDPGCAFNYPVWNEVGETSRRAPLVVAR